MLGSISTAPDCRLHAVMLFWVIKISKHVDQIPPATVWIGHGAGKCWVHWCFEKPNRFACEGFQLIRKCRQFWKILFVLMDGRRHSTNKRLALKFYRFQIAVLISFEFLLSMSSIKYAQRGAALQGEAECLYILLNMKKKHSNMKGRPYTYLTNNITLCKCI